MTQNIASKPQKILLITGVSGAGKTTALKTLEDLGWETVDNFPIKLAGQLLKIPASGGEDGPNIPLALGFDSRTRGFDAEALIRQIRKLQAQPNLEVMTLFLDCAGVEIERRYAETRRRHPMAQDRPAMDGIAIDRAMMAPFRSWAEAVIDTSKLSAHDLQGVIRERFSSDTSPHSNITVSSFGFSRGVPHNADLVFDLRFLRNPHWDSNLRPMTGLDTAVADYVAADPKYDEALKKIRDLLQFLLPLYNAQGKAYINIAFGCTGGRHRSVHVAETFGAWLRADGFALTVAHRDLASRPIDAQEEPANGADRLTSRQGSNIT
ncbi:MAG: RNase adapter RapZ [Pseudomonadota bacterium]